MSINLAEDLLECLSHLEPSDRTKVFALFETETNPTNPGICLKNGGAIGLPLSEGDAKVLKAAANHSSVQSSPGDCTWILPADDFEIQNPAWALFLQSVVTKVSAGLGVDSTGKSVSVGLDHLSLRDAGPVSVTVLSAKSSNVRQRFGTLAITLPSKYDDGEVNFSHGGMRMVEARQSSAFDVSYAAWFSDVSYEQKPISAGCRLVLVYNLFHSTMGPDVLRAGSNKSMAKLDLLFSYWKDNVEEEPSMLASLLENKVADENLSYSGLDGSNLQVVTQLREAAEKYGFCVYLANMERSIKYEEEDDYDYRMYERDIDQSEATSTLTRVVELDGHEIAKGMHFEDDMLIQEGAFEEVEPDDDDGESVLYMRTVVLFMPKQYRIGYFLTPTFPYVVRRYGMYAETKGTTYAPDVTAWCDRLSTNLKHSDNPSDRRDLEEVCKQVTDSMQVWREREAGGLKGQQPFNSTDIARVVVASVELDNKERFLEAFEICPYEIPASTFKSIAAAALRYKLASILPKLRSHVSAFNALSERFDIISAVQEGLAAETLRDTDIDASEYQEWIDNEADRAISDATITKTSAQDGFALAKYCKALPRPEMLDKVIVAIKSNIHCRPMVFAFQTSIFNAGTEGYISQDIVRTVFANIVSAMLKGFGLLAMDALIFPTSFDASTASYSERLSRRAGPAGPVLDSDRTRAIALLLCQCESLHLTTELNYMVLNLAEEAKTINLVQFDIVFLPFLESLGSILRELSISVQGSPFQGLFQQILSTYLERFVQPEPRRPNDWSRPTVVCDCQDCSFLNKFLADPREMTRTFTINGKRRDHVFSKVADTGMDQFTDKTGPCHSLVLTKNDKCFGFAHKAWEERCAVARTHIQRIGTKVDLKSLLAGLYNSITTLAMVSSLERPLSPALHVGGNHMHNQDASQPLQTMANNIQRPNELSALPATISKQWESLPPSPRNVTRETRIIPQGTKRKAAEPLEPNPKRKAPDVIVIDD